MPGSSDENGKYLRDLAAAIGPEKDIDPKLMSKEVEFALQYHERLVGYYPDLPGKEAFINRFCAMLSIMAESEPNTELSALTPAALSRTVSCYRRPVVIESINRAVEGDISDEDIVAAVRLHAGIHMAAHNHNDHIVGFIDDLEPNRENQRDWLTEVALARLQTHCEPYDVREITEHQIDWAVRTCCTIASFMEDEEMLDERVARFAVHGLVPGDENVRSIEALASEIARDADKRRLHLGQRAVAAAAANAIKNACRGNFAGLPGVLTMPAMAALKEGPEKPGLESLRHMAVVVATMLRMGGGVLSSDVTVDAVANIVDLDLLRHVREQRTGVAAILAIASEVIDTDDSWQKLDETDTSVIDECNAIAGAISTMMPVHLSKTINAAGSMPVPTNDEKFILCSVFTASASITEPNSRRIRRAVEDLLGPSRAVRETTGIVWYADNPPVHEYQQMRELARTLASRRDVDRVYMTIAFRTVPIMIVHDGHGPSVVDATRILIGNTGTSSSKPARGVTIH